MDKTAYDAKYLTVKIATRKVRDKMKIFLAENVTSIDIPNYEDRLKEVRNFLDLFNHAVTDLVVDLNESVGLISPSKTPCLKELDIEA